MQAQQQLCPQGEIVTGSHLPKRDETRASVHDARGQGWSRSGAAHMTSRHTGQVIRSSSITPPCAADAAADVAGTAGAANASGAVILCAVPARYLAPVGASNWRVLQPQLLYRDREAGRRAVPAVFVLHVIVTTLPPPDHHLCGRLGTHATRPCYSRVAPRGCVRSSPAVPFRCSGLATCFPSLMC